MTGDTATDSRVGGTLWVVIDPLRAFTDLDGTLARAYGEGELAHIRATVDTLAAHVAHQSPDDAWVWVRSGYQPGQYSDETAGHSLAELCTGENPIDLAWDPSLLPRKGAAVVTKSVTDATTVPAFRELVADAVSREIGKIVVSGFLLTSCVRDTAISVADLVAGSRTRVFVRSDLSAARVSNSVPDEQGVSSVDRALHEVERAGVEVVASC